MKIEGIAVFVVCVLQTKKPRFHFDRKVGRAEGDIDTDSRRRTFIHKNRTKRERAQENKNGPIDETVTMTEGVGSDIEDKAHN